jgi:hypothetical protein
MLVNTTKTSKISQKDPLTLDWLYILIPKTHIRQNPKLKVDPL